jgi:hypothetical protein
MSYQRDGQYWVEATKISGSSITFCSCILDGTKVEQTAQDEREIRIMWIKDMAAGAGLILFMVTAFVLASGAQAVVFHPGI